MTKFIGKQRGVGDRHRAPETINTDQYVVL